MVVSTALVRPILQQASERATFKCHDLVGGVVRMGWYHRLKRIKDNPMPVREQHPSVAISSESPCVRGGTSDFSVSS
jgi:hypothetical protein